ncbi:MAG: hypothetical protein Q9191_003697 [Dirinaria sp. TL-2023a]
MQQRQRVKQKLKDSCNNCAVTKVKCSKDKPVCARCDDRGLACYYGPSYRSGRRSTTSTHSTNPTTTADSTQSATASANATAPPSPQQKVPEKLHDGIFPDPALGTGSEFSWNSFTMPDFSLSGNHQQPVLFPTIDDAFNPEIQPPKFEMNTTLMPSSNDFSSSNKIGPYDQWFNASDLTFSPCMSASPTPPSSYCTNHMTNLTTPSSLNSLLDTTSHLADPGSNCLSQALNLLAALHGTGASCSTSTTGRLPTPRDSPSASSAPIVDEAIATNRNTLEKAMIIVKCPCFSQNEQLVFLVALIAFKVMALYAGAACESAGKSELTNPINLEQAPPIPNTNESSHARAQLVLGELHRVVRLVDMLSKRFEEYRRNTDVSMGGSDDHDSGGGKRDCISTSVFVQLEADLRKHLRAVTKDTMTILRSV